MNWSMFFGTIVALVIMACGAVTVHVGRVMERIPRPISPPATWVSRTLPFVVQTIGTLGFLFGTLAMIGSYMR